MSAPPAGRFQDHYDVLGVDPKSDSETIQRAYTKLAQRYRSTNAETADREKFEAVNIAYEILSDAMLRREFDKVKGVSEDQGTPKFSGSEFFEAIVREKNLRMALLSVLYDRRRTKPFTPSLSMRHIENMLAATTEEITFTLWYLKQRCFASNDEKSSLQITVEGMDFLENHRPSPEIVMAFIRPTALPGPKSPQRQAPPKPLPGAEESGSNMLPINLAPATNKLQQ